jgi:DNA-directed RNA polymerase subunit M/transcription elongation factor TFIIS
MDPLHKYYRELALKYLVSEDNISEKIAIFIETTVYNSSASWAEYSRMINKYKAYNSVELLSFVSLDALCNVKIINRNHIQISVILKIYKFLLSANIYYDIVTDAETLLQYAYEIEYNKFNYSKAFARTVNCIFEDVGWNNTFVGIYKDICANLLQAIDMNSECCQVYGMHNTYAALSGETFENINTMQEYFPIAYEKEVDIINKKREQKIKIKVSTMFRCPQCKTNKCEYTPAQRRALDEPTGVDCRCLNCGYEFHIA